MRLWSLHPRHLDTRALVACWREGLLAYHVLQGKTKGYKNHPQLDRFKDTENPVYFLECYLHGICDEADARGYKFDRTKLGLVTPFVKGGRGDFVPDNLIQKSSPLRGAPLQRSSQTISLTRGQLAYETDHLYKKILQRAPKEMSRLDGEIFTHPIFTLIDGGIEKWEVV